MTTDPRSTRGDTGRGGRVLRWSAAVLGGLAAILVIVVLALVVTTPSPQSAPGWESLDDLPDARGEVASAVTTTSGGERLVVAGGLEGMIAGTSTAVHDLDPVAGSWRRLPDLPEPRHHPGAAAIGGDLYLSGGAPSVTDWTPQASLWVLREGSDRWDRLADMPEGRDSHRMRAHEGRLHVVGGHGRTSDVLTYDPDSDGWSRGAPLPEPRHHLAVVVLDGELWALGGRDHDERVLDAVHVWDPATDEWRDGPPLPEPISAPVEGVVDGRIHLVGGEDPAVPGGGTIAAHWVLDPGDETWTRAGPVPLPVHGAGGAVLGGQVVVTGGAARQGALSPLAWTGFTAAYDPAELP